MKNILIFIAAAAFFLSCGTAEVKNDEKSAGQGFSISLEKTDGGTFSFEDIRGKKHLVAAFWATWCEPCKTELKKLAEMYGDFSDRFEFVGISTDTEEMTDKVVSFAAESALPFPILIDPSGNTVSSIIPGGDTVPYLIVVRSDGTVLYRHSGYTPGDEAALRKELENIASR